MIIRIGVNNNELSLRSYDEERKMGESLEGRTIPWWWFTSKTERVQMGRVRTFEGSAFHVSSWTVSWKSITSSLLSFFSASIVHPNSPSLFYTTMSVNKLAPDFTEVAVVGQDFTDLTLSKFRGNLSNLCVTNLNPSSLTSLSNRQIRHPLFLSFGYVISIDFLLASQEIFLTSTIFSLSFCRFYLCLPHWDHCLLGESWGVQKVKLWGNWSILRFQIFSLSLGQYS